VTAPLTDDLIARLIKLAEHFDECPDLYGTDILLRAAAEALAAASRLPVDERSNGRAESSIQIGSPGENIGVLTVDAQVSARRASAPPAAPPPLESDVEADTRALADRLEQGWRDGGVMRSHSGDLKRAADRLRTLLAALHHAIRSAAPPPWQPIETAPEETVVLVHDEGYVGKGMLMAGRWLDVEVGDAFFDPTPTEWLALPSPPASAPQPEAPACERHGTMVADDEMGRSWHCAVCSASAPAPPEEPEA
jgi:hypothetical protein